MPGAWLTCSSTSYATARSRRSDIRRLHVVTQSRFGSDDSRAAISTPGPVHVVEIVDHPSLLCRAPPNRCCVSALDAGMSIAANKPSQPK